MTGASGNVYVQRTGDIVELNVYGISIPGSASAALSILFGEYGFPAGFRPVSSFSSPIATTGLPPDNFQTRLYMNTVGRCDTNNPGSPLYGLFTYITKDDWPAQLPGAPA